MQEGELGNKQDKTAVCNAESLRTGKEPSGMTCHPQANHIVRLKTLDQNKWTTARLLIRLFWSWHWNEQVPRSRRHSHPLTPRLHVFHWRTALQWEWDARTEGSTSCGVSVVFEEHKAGYFLQMWIWNLLSKAVLCISAEFHREHPWIAKGLGETSKRFGSEAGHWRHVGRQLVSLSVCQDSYAREKLINCQ